MAIWNTKELKEAIAEAEIKELAAAENLEAGSEERQRAINNAVKLHEAYVNDLRGEADQDDKDLRRENEELKAEREEDRAAREEIRNEIKAKEGRIYKCVEYGLTAAGIIVPIVVYVALYHEGLNFEKDGVVKSTMFRNLIGKIKFNK